MPDTAVIPAGTAEGAARNAKPYLHGPERDAVLAVLASGTYGHGPETEQFEQELARFLGVPDVVCAATGTAALQIALLTAGIGPGDEVVVPSFTFCASIQAILACGAHPRFADIDPSTLCTTPQDLLDAITPATRAVMPVLYGGRAIDLTGISQELDAREITVIEDAAHAFGSSSGPRLIGSNDKVLTCFSFDPIKNLTCGEGGAIVPRNPAQAARARTLRCLGITQSLHDRQQSVSYAVAAEGLRAHLPAINAAIGRVQLARFPAVAARRKQLWSAYQAALTGISGITLADVDIANTVPFNCVVLVPDRDRVFAGMRAAGIGVGVHYPPNHLQPAFTAWRRPLPRTEEAAARVLSLPFHPALTDDDLQAVTTSLKEALA
jgi:dTDP-4-amino-4,6-dideoxygalactose transaminase